MRIICAMLTVMISFLAVIGALKPAHQTDYCDAYDVVSNPFNPGCDPWYYLYDGVYYQSYSTGSGVAVRKSDTIMGLHTAEGKQVYNAPSGTEYSYEYWAPEIHCIDGRWYIYVCADDGKNETHRMYVLSCDTPDGNYIMEGKLASTTDEWAIDGTVANINGELYLIWSGWKNSSGEEQYLYIAHMNSPTEIDGERHLISTPSFRWEKQGLALNEGPAVLQKDGRVYIVYSASGSWTEHYCLGMLTLVGSNPLNRSSWYKNPLPVFRSTDDTFGVGHCSFVTSKDGEYNYIVYHGMSERDGGWSGRSERIQRFSFVKGYPVFGKPISGEDIHIAK